MNTISMKMQVGLSETIADATTGNLSVWIPLKY